jgi:hypothetical protein
MELKVRLETLLGLPLPTTAALEHPTVTQLTQFLLPLVLPDLAATETTPPPADDDAVSDPDLTEEQLVALLHREMGELNGERP